MDAIFGTRRGTAPVPLSMLDFAVTGKGHTASQALQATIALAKLADRRGFSRYWMAEHHAMPAAATSSPPVLLARLIGETRQIRLGAGGMMLPNFPPLVVAEQFGLLSALAPGRIDLGLGRAPGTDGQTAAALRRGRAEEDDYPGQVAELLQFLDDDFPEGHPYRGKGVGVSAAEDEGEARRQARSFAHGMMRMMYRKSYVLPSPQEVEAYPYDATELQVIDAWNEKVLYGTGAQVVDKLDRFQASTEADEMMMVNLAHSPAAVLRSAEIMADAYGMPEITFP